MAADVADDAAVAFLLEEPVGARGGRAEAVGAEAGDVDDAADQAEVDEVAGEDGGFGVEAFGVGHHVLAPGRRGGGARFGELVERGEGTLVREVVLAGPHDADAEGGASAGDVGRGDEADGGVVEDFVEGARGLGAGMRVEELLAFRGVRLEHPLEGAAGLGQVLAYSVDVAVLHGGRGEDELARGAGGGGRRRQVDGAAVGGFEVFEGVVGHGEGISQVRRWSRAAEPAAQAVDERHYNASPPAFHLERRASR